VGNIRDAFVHVNSSARIPELDGIRGIAIAMVVMWHYFVSPVVPTRGTLLYYLHAAGYLTWTGVDLFFVLSGFLIGGILLDSREAPNYFRVFYLRRFFRIVPLYVVWLALTCLVLHAVQVGLFPASFRSLLTDRFTMIPYAFYLQNFWMAARNNLGGYSSGGTWSLAIEEQFYLTLPLIIRFAARRRLVWIVAAGIAAAPLLRIIIFFLSPHHRMAAFVLMPCRADSLLLGVLGALLVRDDGWRTKLQKNRVAHTVLLIILIFGAGWLSKHGVGQLTLQMSSVGYTWMAAFYLCVLLFALVHPGSWLGSCLRWRWLRWLGTIAYGVYLFHMPILLAINALVWNSPLEEIRNIGGVIANVAALALTLLVCRVSWIYFEKPLIGIGHRATFKPAPHPEADRVFA